MNNVSYYRKILFLVVLLAPLLFVSGCRYSRHSNYVPERRVMRNLRRGFPDGNFEIVGNTTRLVRIGQIGLDSINWPFHDAHIIKCLDSYVTFYSIDGSNHDAYLRALLQDYLYVWHSHARYKLNNILAGIHTNIYNAHTEIAFLLDSGQDLSFIEGSHVWLRDIESFEEGFTMISDYDDVEKIVLEITYTVFLNQLDVLVELENIESMIRSFAIPLYNAINTEDRTFVIEINIDFLKLDSNNPLQDVRLGSFQWWLNSLNGINLEGTVEKLLSNFETGTVYDTLAEAVNYEGHGLVGAWGSIMDRFRQYHFYEDGTGRITHSGGREFIWRIIDTDYLLIAFTDDDIVWIQKDDDIRATYPHSLTMPLMLEENALDLQVYRGNAAFGTESYVRIEWPSHLQGSWAWVNDTSWITTMNSDGTGSRTCNDCGFHYKRWVVDVESRDLWIIKDGSIGREHWSYERNGNNLTLINWYTEAGQQHGQRFRYTLVE